jgi:molybdopterin/thiamine biosynthesis adenylyltransferase
MSHKSEKHVAAGKAVRCREIAAYSRLPANRADRHTRLPHFIGTPDSPDTRLDALRLVVVGAGSVGGAATLHAARLQPQEILIIDSGQLKPESVLTHLVVPADVGKSKASYWGQLCKAISPTTRVRVFDGPVQLVPLAAFLGATVVFMATDNLTAEVEVGQRCLWLRLPLVQAAVHGDSLVARISWWNNRDSSGPCPACGFSDAEWDHLNRETIFTCAGRAAQPVGSNHAIATRSVSFLCSLAADLAMTQVLRFVLGLGRPLEDSVLEYCGYTHRSVVSPLTRKVNCPCEHAGYIHKPVAGPLAHHSLLQLAAAAQCECPSAPASPSFTVGDLLFVDGAICCGRLQSVRKFAAPGRTLGNCVVCGGSMRAEPHSFHSYRAVPAQILASLIGRPLAQLGARTAHSVLVRHGGCCVQFLQGGDGW